MDVVKIAAMSPTTSKNKMKSFIGVVGFWRMHIPDYTQFVNPLSHVNWKKISEVLNNTFLNKLDRGFKYKRCALHCSWRELFFLETGKKYPGRLKADSWGSGVVDTKDLKPETPQMKKK